MGDYLAKERREWDLTDLRSARFLRLLRLAQSEGLLPELLQASSPAGSMPAANEQPHAPLPHPEGGRLKE